jgi:hypothetical protein
MAMTLLAQEGGASFQKVFHRRAMRLMADAAVLGNRLVVVQERPAFFHVAGVASLVG